MRARLRLFTLFVFAALAAASLTAQSAEKAPAPTKTPRRTSNQQQLVNQALKTWKNFLADPNLPWIREHAGEAMGFLIAPRIVRAGFIFGGSGGRGVLIVRGANGWKGPAFYSIGTASAGFQAGVQFSESVMVVMTQAGLDSLMTQSFTMGADASVAAGPVGAGAGGTVRTDFVSFTRNRGLYGGVSVSGAVIRPSQDWNTAFWAKPLTPIEIIVQGMGHNAGADALLKAVGTAAAPPAAK
jgi:SH3 domain-containing YSC84-like protein 1